MNTKTHQIHTSNGIIHITIGKKYKGTGYSGMSDGVEVTGILTEYDQRLDSATLQDERKMLHAVIPTTLREC